MFLMRSLRALTCADAPMRQSACTLSATATEKPAPVAHRVCRNNPRTVHVHLRAIVCHVYARSRTIYQISYTYIRRDYCGATAHAAPAKAFAGSARVFAITDPVPIAQKNTTTRICELCVREYICQ